MHCRSGILTKTLGYARSSRNGDMSVSQRLRILQLSTHFLVLYEVYACIDVFGCIYPIVPRQPCSAEIAVHCTVSFSLIIPRRFAE